MTRRERALNGLIRDVMFAMIALFLLWLSGNLPGCQTPGAPVPFPRPPVNVDGEWNVTIADTRYEFAFGTLEGSTNRGDGAAWIIGPTRRFYGALSYRADARGITFIVKHRQSDPDDWDGLQRWRFDLRRCGPDGFKGIMPAGIFARDNPVIMERIR